MRSQFSAINKIGFPFSLMWCTMLRTLHSECHMTVGHLTLIKWSSHGNVVDSV